MPLKLNNSFTHTGEEGAIKKAVQTRATFYLTSIDSADNIDLIFLKSCGYYEMIIDEILEQIGFKDLEKISISVKIRTLKGIVCYEDLMKSMDIYLSDVSPYRNRIAHKPEYLLQNDDEFFTKILKIPHQSEKLLIKNTLIKYFTDLYMGPIFIALGIEFHNSNSNFLTFIKK